MRKLFKVSILLFLLILNSCMIPSDQNYDCVEKIKKRPLTEKEIQHIFQFRPGNSNVYINRINYEYRSVGKYDPHCIEYDNINYEVHYEEPESSFSNKLFLENLSKDFFVKLYSEVLEDSVIYAIESYQIQFRNFKSNRANKGGFFILEIDKLEMAKLNGFYIKKTKSGLERVMIKKENEIKYESLVFSPLKS